MTKYKCKRCLKDFDRKCNYETHINRKIPCENYAAKCSKIEESDDNTIKCNYCGREFTRISSLNVHIRERCKVKKENDNKLEEVMTILIELKESNKRLEENAKRNKEEIEKLKETNTKYANIISNTQNNSIGIQNNNIIFKIHAYGTEDVSHITINDYKRIFGRGMNSTPALVEKMHFDKNLPENHNVYISNLRDDYVLMYDGKIWRLKDRDDALQQLYEGH